MRIKKVSYTTILKANPNHHPAGSPGGIGGQFAKASGPLGSNPGGVYTKDGAKYYVKFPNAQGQVAAEESSDKIHAMLGIKSLGHQATDVNGKVGSVNAWQDMEQLGRRGWDNLNDKQIQQAANAYVAAALTKNWDVVGLEYDNIGTTKDGNLVIADTGGSFMYRAMGGPKDYNTDATPELKGMLDRSKTSGSVFSPLMRNHKDKFLDAVRRLKALPEKDLVDATLNMDSSGQVGKTLLGRRQSILRYFGV